MLQALFIYSYLSLDIYNYQSTSPPNQYVTRLIAADLEYNKVVITFMVCKRVNHRYMNSTPHLTSQLTHSPSLPRLYDSDSEFMSARRAMRCCKPYGYTSFSGDFCSVLCFLLRLLRKCVEENMEWKCLASHRSAERISNSFLLGLSYKLKGVD